MSPVQSLRFALLLALGAGLLSTPAPGRAADKPDPKLEAVREKVARIQAEEITKALQAYYVDHDGYPASLAALTRKDNLGGPYIAERGLKDPWGKQYQFNPLGPKNKGAKPDVWTVAPGGKTIGNWPVMKEKKPATKEKKPAG